MLCCTRLAKHDAALFATCGLGCTAQVQCCDRRLASVVVGAFRVRISVVGDTDSVLVRADLRI